MAQNIIMPKAGMAMETGKIIRWLKQEGDAVVKGEPIIEIETDKVTMEVEAEASGILLKKLYGDGAVVPATETIGWLGAEGETIEAAQAASQTPAAGQPATEGANTSAEQQPKAPFSPEGRPAGKLPATPAAKRLAAEQGIDLAAVNPSGKNGEIKLRDVKSVSERTISPLAKRIAEKQGIDITSVSGSGTGGRIVKQDILRGAEAGETVQGQTRKPLSGMRKVIASRMLQSHTQIPPATLCTKADVTSLCALREALNKDGSIKLSYNDFVIKATAIALREFPELNASMDGEYIVYNNRINIGMAVALREGLIVPVIRDVDALDVEGISAQAKSFAEKARAGKLLPDDYSGGTFTVSNLGMYGILSFTPIINPPESAILGVCAIEETLVCEKDCAIEKRKRMGLCLTHDHRLIDGALGAMFLKRITELLEKPRELLR